MSWNINEMSGKTIKECNYNKDYEEIILIMTTGERYKIYHDQDCCELVNIYWSQSNIKNIIDKTIESLEEVSQRPDIEGDSMTITNYIFTFTDGTKANLYWVGESNGYYSEEPIIEKLEG